VESGDLRRHAVRGRGQRDIFYPTWLLRFIVPVTTAGNLSFSLHYILAGLFTYLLLRRLQVGWTGSVVGGWPTS